MLLHLILCIVNVIIAMLLAIIAGTLISERAAVSEIIIAIVFSVLSLFLSYAYFASYLSSDRRTVKTSEKPTVEIKITEIHKNEKVQKDTLYIYKFGKNCHL